MEVFTEVTIICEAYFFCVFHQIGIVLQVGSMQRSEMQNEE